jgi:hypothetical protein
MVASVIVFIMRFKKIRQLVQEILEDEHTRFYKFSKVN